ncbi:MAG: GNAT family N-acetyltransferase [Desulfonatronovibrionaceae bacterium]
MPDLIDLYEQLDTCHPAEPHWHLTFAGVDPACQKQGLGTALIQHSLAHIDARNGVAYLESTTWDSVPLYERLGFQLLGSIQAGSSPPMYPMLRKPRTA